MQFCNSTMDLDGFHTTKRSFIHDFITHCGSCVSGKHGVMLLLLLAACFGLAGWKVTATVPWWWTSKPGDHIRDEPIFMILHISSYAFRDSYIQASILSHRLHKQPEGCWYFGSSCSHEPRFSPFGEVTACSNGGVAFPYLSLQPQSSSA